MDFLTLKGDFKANITIVSNDFIDKYMLEANGEFVKIYLYLLRNFTANQTQMNISTMADSFNHTDADIIRALRYWEKKGLLQLSFSNSKSLDGITLLEIPSEVKEEKKPSQSNSNIGIPQLQLPPAVSKDRKAYTVEQLTKLKDDEDFSQLLYIAQKYLNTTFSPRECDVFAYLYDGLHFSMELLEYLIEYCVSSNHTSIRYMEAVALDWHQKGLMTVEKAKDYAASYNKECFAIMRAFGLTDRRPGEVERTMMEKWFHTYGFTKDIIMEACSRTLAKIHKPSFDYADKILSQWVKEGVKHLGDISQLDKRYQDSTSQKKSQIKTTLNNKFHNFEQRSNDLDAIMFQINDQ